MFPILTDEMLEEFRTRTSPGERRHLDDHFTVKEVFEAARRATHARIQGDATKEILSVTLFWKHVGIQDPEIPAPTRLSMVDAARLGLVKRFSPWEAYIEPMRQHTRGAVSEFPEVTFRVYLASDLEFLIPELTDLGWEVHLMRSPSIRYCPGGFWRFLALEEPDSLVTVIDADRIGQAGNEIRRTRAMHRMGLQLWRVPGYYNSDLTNHVRYRPILGGHFGARGGLPMRDLIAAFLWHTRRDSIDNTVQVPGIGERPILFAQWPGYGFDEWFQLAALYPRLVQGGTLTFVPVDARSVIMPADIEYVMWANPRSELIYF